MFMKLACPEFRLKSFGNRVVWSGVLRPTSISESYLVTIDYKQNQLPSVRVLTPIIEVPREKYAEVHLYADGSLCLHAEEDWNPGRPIANTIVLWTSEWLLYFELWKSTGHWHGGGEYNVTRRDRKKNRRCNRV